MSAAALKSWVKARENPVSDLAFRFAKGVIGFAMPSIPGIHRALYEVHWMVKNSLAAIYRIFWSTPLFQQRLDQTAPGFTCMEECLWCWDPCGSRLGADAGFLGKRPSAHVRLAIANQSF